MTTKFPSGLIVERIGEEQRELAAVLGSAAAHCIAADAEPAGDAGDGRLHELKLTRDVGEVLPASREEQHHGKFSHGEQVFTGLDDGGNDAEKLFRLHNKPYIQYGCVLSIRNGIERVPIGGLGSYSSPDRSNSSDAAATYSPHSR